LAGRASTALGWSFANNTVARLGTLPIGIVLARLLGPHAFGTFAVALVALLAVLSFNDLGVSLAIVRWEGDPGQIAPTVATLSVASSLITYSGCFFGAPAFAAAMGAPAAADVIRVLALNVIVDGVTATPAAMLQRTFRQDRKAVADQVNNWLGVAVSLTLAWQGFGAMSLAIGRMSGAVASGVLFVVFAPVRFGFDRRRARALCRFGLPLAGASIVVFAVTNVDQLVVGHLLGTTALGYYALALNLAAWPVTMFSLPTRAVAPAVFSRLQHDRAAMCSGFLSTAGLLGSATLPICLLLSGAAVPLIGLVYGGRWVPAAHALVWLAMLGALQILFELVFDFFVVLARARVLFTVQLVWLVALVPALIAGARLGGISGAGLAEVGVAACVVLPWYLSELSKVGIRRRSLAARLWLPLLAGVGVGAAGEAAARFIRPDLAALAVGGVLALAAIGVLGYWMRDAIGALRADLSERPATGPEAVAELDPDSAAAGAVLAGAGHAGRDAVLAGVVQSGRDAVLAGVAAPADVAAPAGVAVAGHVADRWRAAAEPAQPPRPAPGRPGPGRPGPGRPAPVRPGPGRADGVGAAPLARPDRGGPGDWRDELPVLPGFCDLTGALPVYRETVARLRWDPASGRPDPADDSRNHHREQS
jgi:O-antigen/teichoic acid export membrane protein